MNWVDCREHSTLPLPVLSQSAWHTAWLQRFRSGNIGIQSIRWNEAK